MQISSFPSSWGEAPEQAEMQSTSNHLWLLSDILGQGATANVFRGRHKVGTMLSLFLSLYFLLTSALTFWFFLGGRGLSKEKGFYNFCDYLRFSLFGGSEPIYPVVLESVSLWNWGKKKKTWKFIGKCFLPSCLTFRWWCMVEGGMVGRQMPTSDSHLLSQGLTLSLK